jgi:Ca2+-binding EF-hand superfamily protein
MITRAIFAATIFAAAFTTGCKNDKGAASPADQGAQEEVGFVEWDDDGDGFLTVDEFNSGIEAWDDDNDNQISEAEFEGDDFDTWDADGDGYLNESELVIIYSSWDVDADGVLDDDEFLL